MAHEQAADTAARGLTNLCDLSWPSADVSTSDERARVKHHRKNQASVCSAISSSSPIDPTISSMTCSVDDS